MKLLTLDIETAPALMYGWGLHKQFHGLDQLVHPSYLMSMGWKWHDQRATHYIDNGGQAFDVDSLSVLHGLLDDADAVVHYNGERFDVPHIQGELATAGFVPPSPFAQIDLLKVVRRQFRFMSNKLDNVGQEFQVGAKIKHEGFPLWLACMGGSEKALRRMERYCKQDVRLTEKLYDRILPWIPNHPDVGLYRDWPGEADGLVPACRVCKSTKVQRRGTAKTRQTVFPRYQCQACGSWFRGKGRIGSSTSA